MAIPTPYQLSDDLVNSVYRNTSLPNSQNTYQPLDILAFLNEEQATTIISLVQSIREKYWVQYLDIPIVSGVTTYTVPERSVAGSVEDIVLVDSANNEIEIAQLADEQRKVAPFYSFVPVASMRGMYARDDTFNIYPITFPFPSGFIIRFKYVRRPSILVLSTSCGQVQSFNLGAKTITFSALPVGWAMNQQVDIINNLPQFTSQEDSAVITNVTGATITLSALPASLTAGMWVCPRGTTCVPQIPVEAYPLLINCACLRVFVAMQNANGFNTTSKVVAAEIDDLKTVLTPRWKGQPKKIINKNVAWPLSSLFPNFR